MTASDHVPAHSRYFLAILERLQMLQEPENGVLVTYLHRLSHQADVLRSSKFKHLVQDAEGEDDLSLASVVRAHAQHVADHALEPAEVGVDQGTPTAA